MELIKSVGRRKTAIARVFLKEGEGKITVNKKEYKNYFTTEYLKNTIIEPLQLIQAENKFDILANIQGGGNKGQAEALRLAISNALVKFNPEFKSLLRSKGMVSTDPRQVERKKPGRKKARKRFQFSKR